MNIKPAQKDKIAVYRIIVVLRFAKSCADEFIYNALDLLVDLENKHQSLASCLIVLDRIVDRPSHVIFGKTDVREIIAEA